MQANVEKLFEIEWTGETLILTPEADLSEFAFQQLDVEAREVLEMLDQAANTNVVVDCRNTDFFGSTALGFFLKLRQRVRRHNGSMVFCNVSDHEKEILHVTKTESLWSICSSRSDALELLRVAAAS
jgi:anti-sigma B factor antagonist